jgi:hypothetical protein
MFLAQETNLKKLHTAVSLFSVTPHMLRKTVQNLVAPQENWQVLQD